MNDCVVFVVVTLFFFFAFNVCPCSSCFKTRNYARLTPTYIDYIHTRQCMSVHPPSRAHHSVCMYVCQSCFCTLRTTTSQQGVIRDVLKGCVQCRVVSADRCEEFYSKQSTTSKLSPRRTKSVQKQRYRSMSQVLGPISAACKGGTAGRCAQKLWLGPILKLGFSSFTTQFDLDIIISLYSCTGTVRWWCVDHFMMFTVSKDSATHFVMSPS